MKRGISLWRMGHIWSQSFVVLYAKQAEMEVLNIMHVWS